MNGYGKRNLPIDARALGLAVVPEDRFAVGIATIPGGQVDHRQCRDVDGLSQTVQIRRQDGSVWIAYARQHLLPADPGEADRATEQASCVLMLLAQAVAAADTARQARGVMVDWDGPPPVWQLHYD